MDNDKINEICPVKSYLFTLELTRKGFNYLQTMGSQLFEIVVLQGPSTFTFLCTVDSSLITEQWTDYSILISGQFMV